MILDIGMHEEVRDHRFKHVQVVNDSSGFRVSVEEQWGNGR